MLVAPLLDVRPFVVVLLVLLVLDVSPLPDVVPRLLLLAVFEVMLFVPLTLLVVAVFEVVFDVVVLFVVDAFMPVGVVPLTWPLTAMLLVVTMIGVLSGIIIAWTTLSVLVTTVFVDSITFPLATIRVLAFAATCVFSAFSCVSTDSRLFIAFCTSASSAFILDVTDALAPDVDVVVEAIAFAPVSEFTLIELVPTESPREVLEPMVVLDFVPAVTELVSELASVGVVSGYEFTAIAFPVPLDALRPNALPYELGDVPIA